jgi:glutamate-1-semialdehyde 2,1-aminomutase
MRIAQGCNTSSKAEGRYPENYPKKIQRGDGAYVWDEAGNRYIDFVCSLGPITLGHHAVDDAVHLAIMDRGTIFSLAHPYEEKLAELLAELIPCAEMSKLFHNGGDATIFAVELAKYYTKRNKVFTFSYHGSIFEAMYKDAIKFDYNEMPPIDDETACVIMEPHTIRAPEEGYLDAIREACDDYGALLIFDEVVSFPRYPQMTAQKTFGVLPDLCCISKGMANGYPISALCGFEEYMKHIADGELFASTTFGGNLVGVSAAIETLERFRDRGVSGALNNLGRQFREGVKENPFVKVVGSINSRLFFECSDENRQKIWQEMIKLGVMFNVPIFFNYAMTLEDIDETLLKLNYVIERLPETKLVGRKATEVFKKI